MLQLEPVGRHAPEQSRRSGDRPGHPRQPRTRARLRAARRRRRVGELHRLRRPSPRVQRRPPPARRRQRRRARTPLHQLLPQAPPPGDRQRPPRPSLRSRHRGDPSTSPPCSTAPTSPGPRSSPASTAPPSSTAGARHRLARRRTLRRPRSTGRRRRHRPPQVSAHRRTPRHLRRRLDDLYRDGVRGRRQTPSSRTEKNNPGPRPSANPLLQPLRPTVHPTKRHPSCCPTCRRLRPRPPEKERLTRTEPCGLRDT